MRAGVQAAILCLWFQSRRTSEISHSIASLNTYATELSKWRAGPAGLIALLKLSYAASDSVQCCISSLRINNTS